MAERHSGQRLRKVAAICEANLPADARGDHSTTVAPMTHVMDNGMLFTNLRNSCAPLPLLISRGASVSTGLRRCPAPAARTTIDSVAWHLMHE